MSAFGGKADTASFPGYVAKFPAVLHVAGHALGKTYALDALPTESDLRSELQTIVRAYRALSYWGGKAS